MPFTFFSKILNLSFTLQPWQVLTVAMVSCLQLNTPESFTQATHIYNNVCTQKEKSLSKIVHPYVLLASKQGHIEEAYEILNYLHKPKRGVIRSGLRISLLVKMNRLDEAIRVLEQIVKGKVI